MIKLPAGRFHSMDCAISYSNAKQERARARLKVKAGKEQRKKDKATRERLKTNGDLIKEAQAVINKYVRLRDHGLPCISCDNLPEQKFGGSMDAGHYRSRGSAPQLRFNLLNISAQCVKCNRYGSGNAIDYRLGLIARIGLSRVEMLEQDNGYRKFSSEYLRRIKKIFNKKARVLQRRISQ